MTRKNAEKLAGEVIPLLRHMFGEGINFDCTEYFQSNETLIGIALKLPGCTSVPVVCLSDMPDDISATDAANIAAILWINDYVGIWTLHFDNKDPSQWGGADPAAGCPGTDR